MRTPLRHQHTNKKDIYILCAFYTRQKNSPPRRARILSIFSSCSARPSFVRLPGLPIDPRPTPSARTEHDATKYYADVIGEHEIFGGVLRRPRPLWALLSVPRGVAKSCQSSFFSLQTLIESLCCVARRFPPLSSSQPKNAIKLITWEITEARR